MASLPFKDKHKTGFKSTRSGSFLKQWNIFFRQFLKHPGMIGSVIPSSRALVDAVLEPVDWERTRLFVEYGPGVGTFARSWRGCTPMRR